MNYTYIITRQWIQTEQITIEADTPDQAVKFAMRYDLDGVKKESLPDQLTITVKQVKENE